ncbi:MAG: flagellar basal body P-ring protein FlgI [Phycisphaerae bacterium]|nr:flagellar basal body P-ring protein FlgI [Phycisphaerae bacterium]
MKFVRAWMPVCFAVIFLGLVGCDKDKMKADWEKFTQKDGAKKKKKIKIPPEIRGTISEVATLVSAGNAPISGVGIVVGLEKKGSTEIPPQLKQGLIKYIKSWIKIGRPSYDTEAISATDFLLDKDTAIVDVSVRVPPGAPKGTRLDVFVSAAARTSTTSLQSGVLLPTEMTWKGVQTGGGKGKLYLKPMGLAEGTIFVNPFINPANPKEKGKFRQGRILGGAKITRDLTIRLELLRPGYQMCSLLQRLINERFPSQGKPVASAKTIHYIEIAVPQRYRNNYRYFLQLILHLPRRGGHGAFTAKAREIAKALKKPNVNYDSLALVWEAMGPSILPIVQKQYASKAPAASYFSARAGLRLGDNHLAGPIVMRFAEATKSPYRLIAIKELGHHPDLLAAGRLLDKLLNDRNELVRIAAYESLIKRNGFSAITRYMVDEGEFEDQPPAFIVDVVNSKRDFVVYATRTLEPKIVLFGRDIPLSTPFFYDSPDNLVTIFEKKALSREKLDAMVKKLKNTAEELKEAAEITKKTGRKLSQQEVREMVIKGQEFDAMKRQFNLGPNGEMPPHERQILAKDHLVVYRKIQNSTEISKRFRINYSVRELIRVLGETPRPDLKTGNVHGLGLTYSQVVGILCQLCKDKNIQAKFVLQQLPEMQRIYRITPSVGRPDTPER